MIPSLFLIFHNYTSTLNSTFTLNDLKKAIPKIGKGHPFLPDRKWLEEDLEEKLKELLTEINQNGWSFSSVENYMEWQGKPISSIKMSTPDWLVHFVILEKIENDLQQFFIPNIAYQISKMEVLLEQCKLWKNENPPAWIIQADVKSFFKNIKHDILLEDLRLELEEPVFLILKQFLNATSDEAIGLAIGAELNYLLASIYLKSVDAAIFNSNEVVHYARYVDDILIFCKSEKECIEVQKMVELELKKLGLELNFLKTKIQSPEETILFLRQEL